MKALFQWLRAEVGLVWRPFALTLAAGWIPALWVQLEQPLSSGVSSKRVITGLDAACYDLPFRWPRRERPPSDMVMVEITSDCLNVAGVGNGHGEVQRPKMAEFLEKLEGLQPRLVILDCLFVASGESPDADARIAAVLGRWHQADRVLIATSHQLGALGQPASIFATNATQAIADVHADAGRTVRLIPGVFEGTVGTHSLCWAAATRLGAEVTREEPVGRLRWLNYLGGRARDRAATGRPVFHWVRFSEVLAQPPPWFGDGKEPPGSWVVVVGGGSNDEFQNPIDGKNIGGAEVHATALANLRTGTWLRTVPDGVQTLAFAGWALGVVCVLDRRRTAGARFGVLGATALLGVGSVVLHRWGNYWWLWLVPVAFQTPAALMWSLLPGRREFFISHRDSDGRDVAQWLEGAILGRGWRAFLAPGRIEYGAPLWSSLARGIRRAKVVLLVLTPDSRRDLLRPFPVAGRDEPAVESENSPWVRREIAMALSLGRPVLVLCVKVPPLKAEELAPEVAGLADVLQMEFGIDRRERAIDAALRLRRSPIREFK